MSIAVIIPARYESTRLPGKPLVTINGKPLIEWVVTAALGSKLADAVIVATDDERIYNFVKEKSSTVKSVKVVMTSKSHKSGTDRIAEIVKNNPEIKYAVNLQGDEPLMPSEYIDKVLEPIHSKKVEMSTLIAPITNNEDLNNPNIVKAVMDKEGFALYFSRLPTPSPFSNFRHLGIYGYSRETLLKFCALPESSLEKTEKLEQLRALENGIRIKLEVVPKAFPAVDTHEDIKLVEKYLLALSI